MDLKQTITQLRHFIKPAALGLIASLIASNASAELPTCPVVNLLQEWKSERPDDYSKVMETADATPNGQNTFWKIEKEGAPTSYLFGTVHVSDHRVTSLPEAVSKAFSEVDHVVLELAEAADPQKLTAAMFKRADLMVAKPGKDVKSLVSEKHIAALDKVLRTRGMTIEGAAALSPIAIYSMLSLPPCEAQRQAGGAAMLDGHLGQMALEQNKELSGLETPVEQMEVLAALPDELMAKILISSAELGETMDHLTSTTIELYLSENLGAITPLMELAANDLTVDEKPSEAETALFEEKLIIQRNINMVDRAVAHLDKAPTMIAVGALHLPGEKGVVELFKAKGYSLTPIPLSR